MRLGGALGLEYPHLTRMPYLMGDLVAAWLNGEDHVMEKSGPPSWSSLIAALRSISQPGIANAIEGNY